MKKLDIEFVSGDGGFSQDPRVYKQVDRSDSVGIYSRTLSNGRLEGFEVFNIAIKPKGSCIFDKVLEDDEEQYPSTGKFGVNAWFCMTEKRAREIFEELTKDAAEKKKPSVKVEMVIPEGEWTVGEFAEKNSIEYPKAFLFVKAEVEKGSVKFIREEQRNTKGKKSKIYAKV